MHQLHWTGTTYSGFPPWKTFWGVRSLRPRKIFPMAIIGDALRCFFFIHKERMMFLSEQRTDCSNCLDLRRTHWSLLVSTIFFLACFKSFFFGNGELVDLFFWILIIYIIVAETTETSTSQHKKNSKLHFSSKVSPWKAWVLLGGLFGSWLRFVKYFKITVPNVFDSW